MDAYLEHASVRSAGIHTIVGKWLVVEFVESLNRLDHAGGFIKNSPCLRKINLLFFFSPPHFSLLLTLISYINLSLKTSDVSSWTSNHIELHAICVHGLVVHVLLGAWSVIGDRITDGSTTQVLGEVLNNS